MPLLPFLAPYLAPGLLANQAPLAVSIGMTGIVFFGIGAIKSRWAVASWWRSGLETLFIGGGTPSLFSPAGMDRLLNAVRARLPLRPDAEITLEANPGTVDQGCFQGYREAGINRLSIGIQSSVKRTGMS